MHLCYIEAYGTIPGINRSVGSVDRSIRGLPGNVNVQDDFLLICKGYSHGQNTCVLSMDIPQLLYSFVWSLSFLEN